MTKVKSANIVCKSAKNGFSGTIFALHSIDKAGTGVYTLRAVVDRTTIFADRKNR